MKYPRPNAKCKDETIVEGRWRARRSINGQFVYGFLVKIGHRVDGILNENSWYKRDIKDEGWPYYSELANINSTTLEPWDEDKDAVYDTDEQLQQLYKLHPEYEW